MGCVEKYLAQYPDESVTQALEFAKAHPPEMQEGFNDMLGNVPAAGRGNGEAGAKRKDAAKRKKKLAQASKARNRKK